MINTVMMVSRLQSAPAENIDDPDLEFAADRYPDLRHLMEELQYHRDNNDDSLREQVIRLERERDDEADDSRALRFALARIEDAVNACRDSADNRWELEHTIRQILTECEV